MSDGQADLDLRLVRYFTVVAEHRHVGRAATALRVAQPSLSRQLTRLERQLGVRLLDRSPRGSRLTAAGEAFLPQAVALLRAADRAAAEARAAAEPSRITIGYTSGIRVTSVARELRRRHPDAEVRTQHVGWDEPHDALLDHRADAVVAREPFPVDGLQVSVLYEEPRVVVVALDHRLAGKESIALDEIADEPLPRMAGDPAWSAYWRIDPRPDGRPAPGGPLVTAAEDKFEVVATGEAVSIVPAGAAALRPDLTEIPLEDAPPCRIVVATRAGDPSPLVADLRDVVRTHLTGPPSRSAW